MRREDDGVTLVELIVVLGLTTLVGVMMLGFLNQTMITSSKANTNAFAERDSQLALREMTEDIRAATKISAASTASTSACGTTTFPAGYANCLSFVIPRSTSSSDTCSKSIVTYGLVAGQVLKDQVDVKPNAGSCTAPVTTQTYSRKVILAKVVNTSTQPLFRYFDNYTNEITGSTILSYQSARNIQVTLRIQAPQTKRTLVFSSTAALRNNR